MSTTPQYSQEIINIGAAPNDQQGDPLRVAFSKINNNFSTLFQTFVNSTISYTSGNVPGQVIFETPVSTFTEGQFYIKSYNDGTPDSQTIQLYAQVNDGGNAVKFTGYGSTFFGNSVSLYDMIVDSGSGNVQILSNPLLSADLTHFISSQIMWVGPNVPGAYISTENSLNSSLATETVVDITTEQP